MDLEIHHGLVVSISTVRRRLVEAGLVTPEPKKRPRYRLDAGLVEADLWRFNDALAAGGPDGDPLARRQCAGECYGGDFAEVVPVVVEV